MNVKKYRDVCRLTFFGRNDKNLNDNTSIYSGFDRTLQIKSGGGINGFNVVSTNTIGFTQAPLITINNGSAYTNNITTNLSTTAAGPIQSLTIANPGTGFTSNPNLYIYGGNPTTQATATCTATAGAITATNLTNAGAAYTSQPLIYWNGGGNANITANEVGGYVINFNIVSGGSGFTSPPLILLVGGGGSGATATCTINAGAINAVNIVNGGNGLYTSAPTVYFYGGGQLNITANMYYLLGSVNVPQPIGINTYFTQPIASYSGGGILNITSNINGANNITGFTITNGGYTNAFTAAPTIIIIGVINNALSIQTTTSTLTNGVITAITNPTTLGPYAAAPSVSVYGGGLPTLSALMNQVNISYGGNSIYQNTKKLRFDLTQELSTLRLADGAVLYCEYVRMPAITNQSCYKNIRLVGCNNLNTWDSCIGNAGNPVLFSCDAGAATNYYLTNTEYSRLQVPNQFLSKGYIEFEMDTILTAAGNWNGISTDFIIKIVVSEIDNELTQDINNAVEYKSAKSFNVVRKFNHHQPEPPNSKIW